jgi:hypothetical protein
MKKILFAIFLIALFFVEFRDLRCECPDASYTERFVNLWVGGCEYSVQICFKCAGVNPYSHVNVMGFKKINPSCNTSMNTQQIFELICQQVYDPNYLRTFICVNEQIVPCEPTDGGIYYAFYREMCWRKVLLPDGTIDYSTCNLANTYCWEFWKMCYDPTLPPPHIRYTLLYGPDYSGQYEELCEGEDEPSDPTVIGIYSTCFELHTPCNP